MQRFVATAAQHAGAYADLLVDVAAELRASLKLRVGLLTAAIILGVGGIVSVWASIVLFAWQLQSRNALALVVAGVLVLGGLLCAWLAMRSGKRGPRRIRLAQELRLDRELLDSWSHSQ